MAYKQRNVESILEEHYGGVDMFDKIFNDPKAEASSDNLQAAVR